MLCVFMKKTSRSAFRCRVAAWQSRMVAICWLGNWHSTDVMLLAYWAITLRTDFSTGAGMRPDTLVMISCSSSSGSDGCRRVIMSFCTHSFSFMLKIGSGRQ